MKKRIVALCLVFALLACLTPAVAAEEAVSRPSVDEILSEYHQKAFEAEFAGEASASTYSPRSGSSGKTLEQETVDSLNAAGYEAYNVTSENYEALESQLQTNFADMDLNPDSSYIIVISGEDSGDSSSGVGPRAAVPAPDMGGDVTNFTYTYNGVTYSMRYMTVTATSNSQLDQEFIYTLPRSRISSYWDSIEEAVLYYATDELTNYIPVGSILSLLTDTFLDENYIKINSDNIIIHGRSVWTEEYIQVYKSSNNTWYSTQCSEFVNAAARCIGSTYDSVTGTITFHEGNESHFRVNSPEFSQLALRKYYAVLGFTSGMLIADRTYEINFYLCDEDNGINYCGNGNILFTQPHWLDLAP